MNDVQLSKFLSLVLRHAPERIQLQLDAAGWADVGALLAACQAHQVPLTRERLEHIVTASDKQRFAFDETGERIRASQGHSVAVELGYTPQSPPEILFHGTPDRFVASIRSQGLLKGKRHHVHLSVDTTTAQKVGDRRGKSVVLTVQAGAMHRAGHAFFISANGVWLVDHVPPQFIGLAPVA
jgi:putative RNA 2'-phosphotransferase